MATHVASASTQTFPAAQDWPWVPGCPHVLQVVGPIDGTMHTWLASGQPVALALPPSPQQDAPAARLAGHWLALAEHWMNTLPALQVAHETKAPASSGLHSEQSETQTPFESSEDEL